MHTLLIRKKFIQSALVACATLFLGAQPAFAQTNPVSTGGNAMQLTQEWDKTFPKSDKVEHQKVTFKNRYGITLVGDLYQPKNASGKLAAIAISGPFGAVKEQSSGLYAQTMAER